MSMRAVGIQPSFFLATWHGFEAAATSQDVSRFIAFLAVVLEAVLSPAFSVYQVSTRKAMRPSSKVMATTTPRPRQPPWRQ